MRLFDAHLHVVDPAFPLVPNQGFVPEPFTVADYRARVAGLDVVGGAVVSGSFQAFDQTYLLAALERLGPGFVGVTQLPADVPDAEVLRLDAAGVRAVRVNLRRGGSAPAADLDRLARRVHELAGWHTELYVDARDLAELAPVLHALPQVSVDHLGLHAHGLPDLLRLVETGAVVKATGFGRVELDVADTVRQVLAVDPRALVTGTDLPSTRARRPFTDADLDLLVAAVPEEHRDAVLELNARRLYRLPA
ncbi:Predicted metal-dependent hydrolase, TIM-barrel fold [Klenkia marina]|uniref:Predicted metal-dependent hydrolase, TIM-barrel fold n=1 Tax=Klenkia marina TaxID=1960309 RepID=A0A1G4XI65_9ACTN|nr:amidohydrolase family protein [Klenkia marina]SCX40837.1 Predicted metal-dependent hydrolase, TIM-barrel fold [Klenkia marina]